MFGAAADNGGKAGRKAPTGPVQPKKRKQQDDGDMFAPPLSHDKRQRMLGGGPGTWDAQGRGGRGGAPGLGAGPAQAKSGMAAVLARRGHAVGTRVSVFWPDHKAWYSATVAAMDGPGCRLQVQYDSGAPEWLDAAKEGRSFEIRILS